MADLGPQAVTSINSGVGGLGRLISGIAGRMQAPIADPTYTANSPSAISTAPAPVAAAPVAAPAPAPAAAPAQAVPAAGNNPYAPGGVIPPTATPEAIAAFRQKVGAQLGDPSGYFDPNVTNESAANKDRAAGFSQRPQAAAQNVIQGGLSGAGGGGSISFRQLGAVAPLIPPVRSASERASHELMDIYGQMHQADIDVAKATAAGNPTAIAEATARQAFLKSPQTAKHIMNLKTIGLTSFGTLNAETAAAQQQ